MGSGYVIQTVGAGRATTRWIGADGTPGRREWRTGYGLAVSPRGKAVAFAGRRRQGLVDRRGRATGCCPFNPVPIAGTGHAVALFGEDCKESDDQQRVLGLRQRRPRRPTTPPRTASSTGPRTCG